VNLTLVLVQADGTQRPIPVKKDRVVIGRKPEVTIRVPVPDVSREHCEVKTTGGKATVKDLGSSNGTYVNRERVQEAELKAGDLLAVGPAVFCVQLDGKPAEIDPKALFARGKAPEPVAAAAAPAARPAAPGPKPGGKAAPGRPTPKKPDESDLAMDPADSGSSFDFDMFKDDDDEKKL
jgi:predicted component of type VI protein secretion system